MPRGYRSAVTALSSPSASWITRARSLVLTLGDPAFEGDPEDRDPRLRGEARGRFPDAALAQRPGERRGDRGELDQLAFLELRVGGDDGLAPAGEFAALSQHAGGRIERRGHGIEWGRVTGRGRHRVDHQLRQCAGAPEQDLALVDEIAEERALAEARALRDLGHRRLRVTSLAVKRERGLFEPAARVWLPAPHACHRSDGSG